jgi:hypothetical protein
MRNIPVSFQFAEHSSSIYEIKAYFDKLKNSICYTYDISREIYVGQPALAIQKEKDKLLLELNIEGGFALLSTVEAMFRTDFICRCRKKKKEQIDKDFKEALKKVDKLYKIDIKETILERWKQEYPSEQHCFTLMKERMEYRNWIAHGRYWNKFHDAGRDKFSFDSLFLEISALISLVGPRLLSVESVGMPVRTI